jgi:hypothetical protein|nr:MAG TPA: hypothetical protein [Caudoviricetes sp.]DAW44402.1 MAG TPA: hypothetical protein [Caudoviricetes sp.]DAX30194.1 MAG TPA: hypothetical protein [Caudoviricetes sp.]
MLAIVTVIGTVAFAALVVGAAMVLKDNADEILDSINK